MELFAIYERSYFLYNHKYILPKKKKSKNAKNIQENSNIFCIYNEARKDLFTVYKIEQVGDSYVIVTEPMHKRD